MALELEYETFKKDSDIKCKNFNLCGSILQKTCNEFGVCLKCEKTLREVKERLDFYPSINCSTCLDKNVEGIQTNCGHKVCIPCFKRCFWEEDYIDYPDFPEECTDIDDEEFITILENGDERKMIFYFKKYPVLLEYYELNASNYNLNREIYLKNLCLKLYTGKCPICI